MCASHEGDVYRRGLLGDAVDVVCDFSDRSLTLVKPSSDIHGLQARFEELVGKPLAYRIATTQDQARKRAAADDLTPQEGNMEGYSAPELFATILHAVRAAAQPAPQADVKRPRKPRHRRSRAAA
ncbi:MAG TPA: hypothetical protein VJ843_01960 [Candidatus Saccharimonadales bacterium]|nr:hypothetical protein [Candidatus Saccharimonadales bacterium]